MKQLKYALCMLVVVLIFPIIVFALQNVLVLKVEIQKNDTVNLLDFHLEEGTESVELTDHVRDYKIKLKSNTGQVLYLKYFEPSFDVLIDPLPGQEAPSNGSISLDKVTTTLKINYVDGAKTLELYHKDNRILVATIELCNNNKICEIDKKENYLSCPSDCPSGSNDNYCDRVLDGKCDLDCGVIELDIDCTCGDGICSERENPKTCPRDCKASSVGLDMALYVIALAAIILIAGLVYLLNRRKKSRKLN